MVFNTLRCTLRVSFSFYLLSQNNIGEANGCPNLGNDWLFFYAIPGRQVCALFWWFGRAFMTCGCVRAVQSRAVHCSVCVCLSPDVIPWAGAPIHPQQSADPRLQEIFTAFWSACVSGGSCMAGAADLQRRFPLAFPQTPHNLGPCVMLWSTHSSISCPQTPV